MITTRITLKPHLKEYVCGKYAAFDEAKPVQFPAHTDLYLLIWDYLVKRPAGCGRDAGNLEIVLPARHGAKPPEYYNYLSPRAQKIICRRIEMMMWAEYRSFIETERHRRGTLFAILTEQFMTQYGITSLSEDAFQKNYYRWRRKCHGLHKNTEKISA
jgi:hypothetical protein